VRTGVKDLDLELLDLVLKFVDLDLAVAGLDTSLIFDLIFFTDCTPLLSPNQQCQSTGGGVKYQHLCLS